MKETSDDSTQRDQAFWLGWFANAVRKALTKLEAVDEKNEPVDSREDVANDLRFAWDGFIESPDARSSVFQEMNSQTWAGFVVESATGQAQALRLNYDGARAALDQAESYWDDAVGNHRYVASLYPFQIRQITHEEWNEILESGQPVLDQEG